MGKGELKLSLFVEGMITYVENPKESTNKQINKNLLELISEFIKGTRYKVITQKSTIFLLAMNIWKPKF